MNQKLVSKLIMLGACLLLALELGAVPLTLQYQGQVLVSGVPHEGSSRFKFALVNSQAVSLWSHDLSSQNGSEPTTALILPVTRGLYAIRLGDTRVNGMAAIPATVFTNELIRLRVWFNDGTNGFQHLTPDREIGSVAFAVRARTAEIAETLPAGLVTQNHLSTSLQNTLSSLQLQISVLSNLVNNVHLPEFNQTRDDVVALSNLVNNVQLPSLNQTRGDLAVLSNQVNNVQGPELAQTRTNVAGLLALNENTTFASTDPQDPALLAVGAAVFRELPASGWENGPDGAPAARTDHSVVWNGRELIVWGGAAGGSSLLNSGAKYNPVTRTWVPLATQDAPVARRRHEAVWMTDRMFIWGGHDGTGWNPVGGQFHPDHQRWFPVPMSPLLAREDHVMLWTGRQVAIWGGRHAVGRLGDGALFDPVQNRWTPIPPQGAPVARSAAAGVWTGSELIIWGGRTTLFEVGDGARLTINNGMPTQWRPLSRMGAPPPRQNHTAVWTGDRMLTWGGIAGSVLLDDGGSYDPVTDSWTRITRMGAPSARQGHGAIWTGKEMVIFGGEDQDGATSSGYAYDPDRDAWRALPSTGNPLARTDFGTAWTGREILIFGGDANGTPTAELQSLNPEPPVFLYRK